MKAILRFPWALLLVVVATHAKILAQEPKPAIDFPVGGFHLEVPAGWVQMPPVLVEQLKGLLKQKMMGTPLERITFNTGLIRGGNFQSLLSGEYLIITSSPEVPTPAMIAAAYPQAKRETEKATQFVWDDTIADFGWEQLVFNPQRGCIIWPGKAKNFDGSVLKAKFYAFPTKGNTMILFAFGGSKQPDKVFAEIDAALGESPIKKEMRQAPAWWEEFTKSPPKDATWKAAPAK